MKNKNMFLLTFLILAVSVSADDFPIDSLNNPDKIIWNLGKETSRNILKLDKISSQKAQTHRTPWSGYYYPAALGGAAYRSFDQGYLSILNGYHDASYAFPALNSYVWSYMGKGATSATEKYDKALGDKNFTLTKYSLSKSLEFYQTYGRVPEWFGLCHGWAPVSMMSLEPLKSVEVLSPSGESIFFTPSDIKALLTLLWANKSSDLIGGRCERSYIKDNSRSNPPECRDLNPGSFHILLMNQVGINKSSFIVDVENTNEVWNHPVYKYEFDYYNVKSNFSYTDILKNIIPIKKVSLNRRGRAASTRYVIGVKMRYSYVDVDYSFSVGKKESKTVELFYDLELDEMYNILGGEWRSQNYPDFAWSPKRTAMRVYAEEYLQEILTKDNKVSKGVKALALGGVIGGVSVSGFSKNLIPIPSFIYKLLKRSR